MNVGREILSKTRQLQKMNRPDSDNRGERNQKPGQTESENCEPEIEKRVLCTCAHAGLLCLSGRKQ